MIKKEEGLPVDGLIYIHVAVALVKVEKHALQRHLVRWSDTVGALRCFM